MAEIIMGINPLQAKWAAREIYEQSTLANEHAISGAHPEWLNASVKDIHRNFEKLAVALGYIVERAEPVASFSSTINSTALGLSPGAGV